MKVLSVNDIQWRTTNPVSSMNIGWDSDDKPIPVPKYLLTKKLKIRKNDRVVLVYHNSKPIITAPIVGYTVKDLFQSINKGMKMIIKPDRDNVENVYSIISRFVPKRRSILIDLFEKNKLTPYHLVRDNYDFYEGNLKRERNGIWTYAVGS
jgi:hypothetical protein